MVWFGQNSVIQSWSNYSIHIFTCLNHDTIVLEVNDTISCFVSCHLKKDDDAKEIGNPLNFYHGQTRLKLDCWCLCFEQAVLFRLSMLVSIPKILLSYGAPCQESNPPLLLDPTVWCPIY